MKYPHKDGIRRTNSNHKLYDRALACAIKDVPKCKTIEQARDKLIKWEAFRNDIKFKEVINLLKNKFNGK